MRPALLVYTCFTLVLVLGAAGSAGAVTTEQAARALQSGRRVYDFAGVLSPTAARQLQERLEGLERAGLAEGAVLILDRLEGATIEEFALAIGERWKIGRKDADNGFVLVVSLADRKWRLEVAQGLQGMLPDSVAGRLMRENLVPAFRRQRYFEGLDAAIAAIERRLQQAGGVEALPLKPPERAPSPLLPLLALALGLATAVAARKAWPRGTEGGRDPWRLPAILAGGGAFAAAALAAAQAPGAALSLVALGLVPGSFAAVRGAEAAWAPVRLETAAILARRWGAVYAVAGLGLFLALMLLQPSVWGAAAFLVGLAMAPGLGAYLRRMPRRCPECAGTLRWLPEAEESRFLREDETLEQRLGSVDYDVWRCARCDRSAIFPHVCLRAPYMRCPKCRRRTLTHRSVVEQRATAFSDGWAVDIRECLNPRCRFVERTRRRIERESGGFGGTGVIFLPSGGWGGGSSGSAGDFGGSGGVGDFGGGGGFDGGGASGDW